MMEKIGKNSSLFYELGKRMKKYSISLGILLGVIFFLLLPIAIYFLFMGQYFDQGIIFFSIVAGVSLIFAGVSLLTLVFKVQYIITIHKLAVTTRDETLEKVYFFQILAFIFSLIGLGIVSIVLNFLSFSELRVWFQKLTEQNHHPRLTRLEEHFNFIKWGYILSILGFGIFLIPTAFFQAGNELIQEHSRSEFQWIKTIPMTRNTSVDSQPKVSGKSYCHSCGTQILDSQAKFCEICGQKL